MALVSEVEDRRTAGSQAHPMCCDMAQVSPCERRGSVEKCGLCIQGVEWESGGCH